MDLKNAKNLEKLYYYLSFLIWLPLILIGVVVEVLYEALTYLCKVRKTLGVYIGKKLLRMTGMYISDPHIRKNYTAYMLWEFELERHKLSRRQRRKLQNTTDNKLGVQ